jgi:tRNA A64-2'-O-ribosylphosphate transferase
LCWDNFDIVINCTDQEYPENKKDIYSKRYLHLNIPASKKGQHVLFSCVPIAVKFCKDPIASGKSILVHGIEGNITYEEQNIFEAIANELELGKDRAVGIALALLVQYYDTNGTPNTNVSQTPVGK